MLQFITNSGFLSCSINKDLFYFNHILLESIALKRIMIDRGCKQQISENTITLKFTNSASQSHEASQSGNFIHFCSLIITVVNQMRHPQNLQQTHTKTRQITENSQFAVLAERQRDISQLLQSSVNRRFCLHEMYQGCLKITIVTD